MWIKYEAQSFGILPTQNTKSVNCVHKKSWDVLHVLSGVSVSIRQMVHEDEYQNAICEHFPQINSTRN